MTRVEKRRGYTVRTAGARPALPAGSAFDGGRRAPGLASPTSDREMREILAGPFRDWRRKTGATRRFRELPAHRQPTVAYYELPHSLVRDGARVARGERLS